jgi:hypothetical protein
MKMAARRTTRAACNDRLIWHVLTKTLCGCISDGYGGVSCRRHTIRSSELDRERCTQVFEDAFVSLRCRTHERTNFGDIIFNKVDGVSSAHAAANLESIAHVGRNQRRYQSYRDVLRLAHRL